MSFTGFEFVFPDWTTLLIVCPLVFIGGLVDAIAGGGGLITVPAYLLAGVPPHLAVGTNKLSSGMGMAISTWRLYRAGFIDFRKTLMPALVAFIGALLGANISLLLSPETFGLILLILLPIAGLIVLQPRAFDDSQRSQADVNQWLLALIAFACGMYDGFYGPGAGTFMLIGFIAIAGLEVRYAAGQKIVVNSLSGFAALIAFGWAGEVDWILGFIAGCFGILGHYIGSGLVVNNGLRIVRPIIASVIALLFAKTIYDLWF